MTDKEKIKFWAKGRLFEIMNGIGENDAKNILTDLLSFIDSMQEEPVSEEQVKESLISKHEDKTCKENGNSLTQELVNKDFEMALAEMIDKAQKCVVEPLVVAEQWKDELIKLAKSEEPVNEDFKIALEKKVREAQDWTYIEEEGCECPLSEEFGAYDLEEFARWGAEWQKEQFEKNRLKHCNSITNEQAELEQGFIDQHLNKYQRIPTFLDAVEYGMNLQKEQMIAKAFDFTQEHNIACILASECLRNHGWFSRERVFNNLFRHLACVDKLFEGKFSGKTKVIVIKEE